MIYFCRKCVISASHKHIQAPSRLHLRLVLFTCAASLIFLQTLTVKQRASLRADVTDLCFKIAQMAPRTDSMIIILSEKPLNYLLRTIGMHEGDKDAESELGLSPIINS